MRVSITWAYMLHVCDCIYACQRVHGGQRLMLALDNFLYYLQLY